MSIDMNVLDKLAEEKDKLEKKMRDPKAINSEKYQELSKRYSSLKKIAQKYEQLKSLENEIQEEEIMLSEESDPDMKELIENDLKENKNQKNKVIDEIKESLLPEDTLDRRNAIVEIRAGAGGEESALFSSDLFRMYAKYAEGKNWKIELMDSHRTSKGGFKRINFAVEGKNAFKNLKYESGVHRVQRVPDTESSGRIHTSTASVAVLPEAEEIEVEIEPQELYIETFRSSGPGGQHANVTDSAVRITHEPTDIMVSCQDESSQHKNKKKAMRILRTRLKEKLEEEKKKERSEKRRSQIGSADRSEKIRTYNFPQNRVTDHRIELTLYQLESILEGNLDLLIKELAREEREEMLKNIEEYSELI